MHVQERVLVVKQRIFSLHTVQLMSHTGFNFPAECIVHYTCTFNHLSKLHVHLITFVACSCMCVQPACIEMYYTMSCSFEKVTTCTCSAV